MQRLENCFQPLQLVCQGAFLLFSLQSNLEVKHIWDVNDGWNLPKTIDYEEVGVTLFEP